MIISLRPFKIIELSTSVDVLIVKTYCARPYMESNPCGWVVD